jgi:DNA mismatch repair protein MLH1
VRSLLARFTQQHGQDGQVFRNFTFVGVMDDRYTAVQLETRLLLIDHARLSRHLFYQLGIRRFACVPRLQLSTPVPVQGFIQLALDLPEAQWDAAKDRSKAEIVAEAARVLLENADMLREYFGIDIAATSDEEVGDLEGEEGGGEEAQKGVGSKKEEKQGLVELLALPALLEGFAPRAAALPIFLLRLATDTKWDDEQECFHGVAAHIATFYSALVDSQRKYVPGAKPEPALESLLQGLLLPAIKALLLAPKDVFIDDTVIQIAALDQLYKVFERC